MAARRTRNTSRRNSSGRFAFDRPALPALALSVNTSCVTAIGNDYGFDLVFSRQIEALAHRGDVAIGISTSGQSANVLRAMATAKKMGLHTVGLTGSAGSKLSGCGGSLHLRAVERNASHSGMSHPDWAHHFRISGADDIS